MLKLIKSLFVARPPSPTEPTESFTVEVERFLHSLPQVRTVTRVPDEPALDVVTTGGTRRLYLANAFAESREMSPAQRRAKIALFFALVVENEHDETYEDARPTFVPVLRGATYGMELWMKEPTAAFVRKPFLPFIDMIVAMDRPTSMSFVSLNTIGRWKIDERTLFEDAASVLPALGEASVELYDETHGPLWSVTANDAYDSSRLLVPGWLASFRGKVDGAPIAIIPERGTLMVGGGGCTDMIERLLDKANREFRSSNRRLSPALYTVDDVGSVIPYVRSGSDKLSNSTRMAHEELALYEYGEQTAALEKQCAANGDDAFVTSYQVFERTNGELHSMCIWPKGVRTYLPRTENVALLVPGEGQGAKAKAIVHVRFEDIERRVRRMEGAYPVRYETGEFPNEEEMARMAGE